MVKWIDITEQLPTSSKEVLVKCKHSVKHYGIAKYESGSWWEYFADDSIKGWAAFEGEITHWMDIENLQEPASEELNTAIERYIEQHKSELTGYFDIRRIAKHFAQWQREQMMNDAVEADIAESFTPISENPNIYMHGFTCVYEEKESTPYVVAPCKVKLIIIKD